MCLSSWKFSSDEKEAVLQKRIIDNCQRYVDLFVELFNEGCGLVFYGPVGTGKDHLMVAVAREIIQRWCVPVLCTNGTSMFIEQKSTFRQNAEISERGLAKKLIDQKILAISDPIPPLGELTSSQSAFLFDVIDGRYRSKRPTWVTCNVKGGEEAGAKMSHPIVDRLRHNSLALHCNWGSFRKTLDWN